MQTILNINVVTDSVLEIFFTSNPAIAWVNEATSATKTPNFKSKSGLIRIIVKMKPRIRTVLLVCFTFSLRYFIRILLTS